VSSHCICSVHVAARMSSRSCPEGGWRWFLGSVGSRAGEVVVPEDSHERTGAAAPLRRTPPGSRSPGHAPGAISLMSIRLWATFAVGPTLSGLRHENPARLAPRSPVGDSIRLAFGLNQRTQGHPSTDSLLSIKA
jgi:hypothetical protein